MKEKIYGMLYNILAKHMPLSNSKINIGQKKLRYICMKNRIRYVGKNVNIEKGAQVSRKVSIGDYSGIGVNAELNGEIYIGEHVLMGPEVVMYTVNHQFEDGNVNIDKQGYCKEDPIYIEDDVWIGRRVIILPGVRIGRGAVIGAGAVVAKDIPECAVAVGNPVRIIKYRKK